MVMECRIKISSEGATRETLPDLCRTFGALFRDDLETLGWHPMLVYIAPLVLKKFLCVISISKIKICSKAEKLAFILNAKQ